MKRFLFGIIAFLVPVAVFLAALEILVHTIPNSYSYKYNYVKVNGKNLKALVLGHSQLYDGFMPEVFKVSSFNLCNSSQNYRDDYYILKELLPYMPSLKIVILPIGYVTVKKVDDCRFSDRSVFYHEYMKIDYDKQLPLLNYLECFAPKRAFEKITSYYLHHIDIVGCDSLGRRSTHSLKDRKNAEVIPNQLLAYTLDTHDKSSMFLRGEHYLVKIGRLLQSKHIKLVLVSPPHYWVCFNCSNSVQKMFLQEKIIYNKDFFPFQYINMENDQRFSDEDFFDDAHLSEKGALKFTKILNDSIRM